MKSTPPLFTIVMPTRNRAHILTNALRSALNQTFDDYEIIVMANNCSDNTKEVVESLATSRVQYYETDKTLSMPDNWEYAWTKARGKYVTYLSDDDALIPSALQLLADHALEGNPPVISWEDGIYYYPNETDPTVQNNLLLLFFFGNTLIEDVDSTTLLNQLINLEFSWTASIPKMNNCAVDRIFWEEWRNRLGRLFFPIAPDYSFAWISTQICPTIRIVRRPLSVRGISDNSIGADGNLGSAGQAFFKEFDKINFFLESPIDLPTSMNIIASTFSQINAAFIKCGKSPKVVDKKALIIALTKQIIEFRHLLPDYQKYLNKLIDSAHDISDSFKKEIYTITIDDKSAQRVESALELQKGIQKSTLKFPLKIKREILTHNNDLQSALCTLGLRNDVLADRNWACVYIFGDALHSKNIYEMSQHVDLYYNMLLQGRNKKIHRAPKRIRTIAASSFKYVKNKLHNVLGPHQY